jgi:hypothetical protein
MHEPSDPANDASTARGRRRTPKTEPALRNGAVFTDSRVEIEIDDETGTPQLRIVAGARPKD